MEERFEEIEALRSEILEAVHSKNVTKLRDIFENTMEQDVAEALNPIESVADLLFIFRVVPSEKTAEVFTELDIETQSRIISAFGDKQIVELLENSFTDDIVDSLQDMPANLVSRVLKVASPEMRKDINRLLNYKDDTAGSVMTTEYLLFPKSLTVEDTIDAIREKGKDAETIYTVFVMDSKRSLVGIVNLDDLIFAKKKDTLEDIMEVDFVTCNVNDDQEEVSKQFKKYDLNAMAVLNNDEKICGIITIDDIVDVITDEAAEDIAAISGVRPMEDTYLGTKVWRIALKCAPWIIALMVLQVFSSLILSTFQNEIAKFAILSVFTPLIMDAAGNSGSQSTGLMIRSMTLDEFKRGDMKKVVWKEFRVASLVAAIIAIFAFGWIMFEMSVGLVKCSAADFPSIKITDDNILHLVVAALVCCTVFISIIVSKVCGVLLCFLAKKIKRDPAVMATPLITTIVDIVSLVSYFLLWTYCFGPLVGLI